jgi:hypothetical protein
VFKALLMGAFTRVSEGNSVSLGEYVNYLFPPALLPDDCWLGFQRAVVEESVFPCRYYSTVVLHAHISPGG